MYKIVLQLPESEYVQWSGRRDSNSRQPAWKAGTLATELRPHLLCDLTYGGE